MVGKLQPKSGLSAAAVTTIPEKWDRAWFRGFITNFLVNADVRNAVFSDGTSLVNSVGVAQAPVVNTTTITENVNPFTATTAGTVPASGGGTTNFIRADGTWAAPSGSVTGAAGSNTQVQFNSGGNFAASSSFTWDGTTVAATQFNATSDPTMKDNIERIKNFGAIIDNLNGYKYTWKESGKPSIGVLSTEVRAVAPELVSKILDHDAVNYNGLVAILIEEVKSLRQRVAQLERLGDPNWPQTF